MALTSFQREILKLISRNRSPDSHFAGGATLNVGNARISRDFDIFHDAAAQVALNAEQDLAALRAAGFQANETALSRPERGFVEAEVSRGADITDIQWLVDSAVRFFPVVEDEEFGWRLHELDLAVNKVLALAGRREARDYYDLVMLEKRGVSLAALAWAAPAKDPGFTPELLLDEVSRHAAYQESELRAKIDADPFPDPVDLKRAFLQALGHARHVVEAAPMAEAGSLYLDRDQKAVDPLEAVGRNDVTRHQARAGGSWPIFASGLK